MRASKIRFPILKVYYKVIKKNIPAFFLYIVIALLISVLQVRYGASNQTANYEETKSRVVYIDYDNTPLTRGLKDSIAPNSEFQNFKDDKEVLSDALFFHSAQYIVKIPKGFTQQFLNGENVSISKTVGQNEYSSVNLDLIINNYLTSARLYNKALPNISQEQLVTDVKNSISQKTQISAKSFGSNNTVQQASGYFGFIAYAIVSIIFLCISTIMMVFNNKELRSRNMASPLSNSSMSVQLFAGHLTLTLILWACCILLGLILYGPGLLSTNLIFYCLNLLCVSLACLSISFLLGSFTMNRGAQHGIANVLSLGLAFISGMFVPQSLLSNEVLSVAHFTPTYWYVKASNDIGSLTAFTSETLSPVINAMLIQLGFAAALFVLAMVVTRQRKTA